MSNLMFVSVYGHVCVCVFVSMNDVVCLLRIYNVIKMLEVCLISKSEKNKYFPHIFVDLLKQIYRHFLYIFKLGLTNA